MIAIVSVARVDARTDSPRSAAALPAAQRKVVERMNAMWMPGRVGARIERRPGLEGDGQWSNIRRTDHGRSRTRLQDHPWLVAGSGQRL
jgi:hypothetical protein